MDPHSPNKLIATKYCFSWSGMIPVSFSFFMLCCLFLIINFYKKYLLLLIFFSCSGKVRNFPCSGFYRRPFWTAGWRNNWTSAFAVLNLLLLLTAKKEKKNTASYAGYRTWSFDEFVPPFVYHSLNLFWMSHSCVYFMPSVWRWKIHHLVSPSTVFSHLCCEF